MDFIRIRRSISGALSALVLAGCKIIRDRPHFLKETAAQCRNWAAAERFYSPERARWQYSGDPHIDDVAGIIGAFHAISLI